VIIYSLRCENSHEFEEWFSSSAAYDDQAAGGTLVCPECNSHNVEKAPMAPAVGSGKKSGGDCGFAGADTRSGAPACLNACGGGCLPR
jgi:hypothetical protein